MAAAPRGHRAGNEIEGVGGAGVFGDAVVVIVGLARHGIEDDVLQDGAKANGIPDLRLPRAREAYGLRIAAPLEIEYAAIRPAVLIIADKPALWIGRQRGFTRAGQ